MRPTVRLLEVQVDGSTVTVTWDVQPATPLYRSTSFTMTFPDTLDVDRVPPGLWWRVAMWCLYPHWVLLRPCRVILPFRLPEGEREFWLRLCDAAAWTLEARSGGTDTSRSVDLVETGTVLPVGPSPGRDHLTVSCFSGGRDSLAQVGLLRELAEPALLTTVVSPRDGSVEHTSARHREVMRQIVSRTGLELVTVRSDFRTCIDNGFRGDETGLAVTELTDCLLYLGAALVVAWCRGADHVAMAAEFEVHATQRRAGMIVQHPHFMYSAVTQRALSDLAARGWGITVGGLTAPLRQLQVQRLLARCYPDLRDLQYSCWQLDEDQRACSRCRECARIAWYLLSDGLPPSIASIDLRTVLLEAPSVVVQDPASGFSGPGEEVSRGARLDRQRQIASVDPDLVHTCVDGDQAAMAAFHRIQAAVRAGAPGPSHEPGYSPEYLDLLPARHRDSLAVIFDKHVIAEPSPEAAANVERSRTLSRWIAAPLEQAVAATATAAPAPRPPTPTRFAPPPPLTAAEWGRVQPVLPDPEPPLRPGESGRVLRVADTDLAGSEAEYLRQCIEDNHISSTGSFVARFEEDFAALAGTRHAIACSSGTAALQLAYAAAGVGSGDEVIMPAFTMIATANAASHLGARPVFVDTDPGTWNLSVSATVDAITPVTSAIVLVHTYGRPVDPRPFREIADRNGLALIEDAAEAHGGRAAGAPVGSLGDVAAFSFYGNKILSTGEGGMVTTDDDRIAAVARELRDHGFSAERHFWHRLRAYNFRMSNLQAAVGVAQVERADELIAVRRRIAAEYDRALAGIPGIALPPPAPPEVEPVTWMYGIRVTDGFPLSRDEVRRRLASDGVESRTFFVPLHLQPSYLRVHPGSFPVAEQLAAEGLYLPSGYSMTRRDIDRVAQCLASLSVSSPSSP